MTLAEVLPYVTSIGALFVLIGFVLLIWREGVAKSFSILAFFSIVIGILLAAGSIYLQGNQEPQSLGYPSISREAAHACLDAAQKTYVDGLARAHIVCAMKDGWPDRDCVLRTDIGRTLYQRLNRDNVACYQ